DNEALSLEEDDDEAQNRIVAAAKEAQQHRQAGPKTNIGSNCHQVGPAHAAHDHDLSAAVFTKCANHGADAAPIDPSVRDLRDLGLGLALKTNDVYSPAAPGDELRDLARHAGAARKDAERCSLILGARAGCNIGQCC